MGSVVIRDALAAGYRVRCLDLLVYGGRTLVGFMNHPNFQLIKGDIRDKQTLHSCLDGVEAIVHLAAIVGDLPCQVAPKSSYQINFQGTQLLADLAKRHKIRRFVFASTCSNYGIADVSKPIDETKPLNPVSLYAETKIDCENYLISMADDCFHPTNLRFGTAFGVSFRTRFDLLVNSFVYEALNTNALVVFAANMWRPYIHVVDMSKIIVGILKAETCLITKQIFNAGATSQNYRKEEVVEMILKELPKIKIRYVNDIDDKRNYRVDFAKLENTIGFNPSRTVRQGIQELIFCFQNSMLNNDDYDNNNLESLKQFYKQQETQLAITI